jgi:alpha-tubulin N-acetyltransferase 1
MLRNESIHPSKMGYDRPSPKLIGFLSKHYGLVNYIPQNNNYVVFKDYFKGPTHSVGERPLSKAGKEMLSNNYQSKHELITQSYINKLCQVKSLSVKQVGAPPHKMPPKPAAVHTQDQSSRIDKTYFKEDIIAPIWKYKKAPWGLYMNNQYTNKTASSEIGSFLKSTYGSKK